MGAFKSTKRACFGDKDRIYLNALNSGVSFKINSLNQIIIKNGSGVTTIILTPYVTQAPKPVTFSDTYKPNLNDNPEALIKF
jgi:hypothetical protein